MKTDETIKVCGSITKKESLIPVNSNILEHSWVAEANLPYANYYGQVPGKAKSNSLFLFTDRFYSLEEVLRFSQGIDDCYTENLYTASATLEFRNRQFPAIRIKNFPDYKHLHLLQNCYAQQGVLFAQKIHFITEVNAVINKCFELKKLDEGIYLDMVEENKGYLFTEKRIDRDNFEKVIVNIRNNSNCRFFDAVPGGFIINSQSKDIIRIFSEQLTLEVLRCIKYQFQNNKIIA